MSMNWTKWGRDFFASLFRHIGTAGMTSRSCKPTPYPKMKRTLLLLLLASSALALASGCMMPNYSRLVPENKSAHIMVFSPLYGWAVIDTRVVNDTNTLGPLPPSPAVPTVIIGK